MSETRYPVYITLTPKESLKLYEFSTKLGLKKGEVVGLLITKAQIIEDDDGAFQLADESLVIQKGQSDVN